MLITEIYISLQANWKEQLLAYVKTKLYRVNKIMPVGNKFTAGP